MDFLLPHLDAAITFLVTAFSFLCAMYVKFSFVSSRLDKVEMRIDILEQSAKESNIKIEKIEANLVTRLSRIEDKLDNFIQKQI